MSLVKFLGATCSAPVQTFYRQLVQITVLAPFILRSRIPLFKTSRPWTITRSGPNSLSMILGYTSYHLGHLYHDDSFHGVARRRAGQMIFLSANVPELGNSIPSVTVGQHRCGGRNNFEQNLRHLTNLLVQPSSRSGDQHRTLYLAVIADQGRCYAHRSRNCFLDTDCIAVSADFLQLRADHGWVGERLRG